ncbi:hypothetical protein QSV34_04315 [Porticoccus sp. W117]|uniref:hypothetical protein n=1 Tax=Porticoccus sp. W117 TaxID=3054777 RepID=UPI002596C3D6|nr:hypothetical protein [Porticoccus sp. W117]MDM3870578.1 hypothetical protein [Porticoccus sp. W117]
MLERDKNISTEQKALSINLDDHKYGTIVEIGAGQEVARQFFKAGAAAGTIAKTSSAYDMTVSDAIYGKAGRYVSRERVHQMLNLEFDLCVNRLAEVRPPMSTFFSYAATVTARSFKGGNECHGWIGVRLQLRPKEEPCEIVCHVRMLDNTNELQAEALGILGVNLIYAAYNYSHKPKWLIESLLDGIGQGRIEVDLIDFDGPGFSYIDSRLANLYLVNSWLTRAVLFDETGTPVVPRDFLYKKPVAVMRSSFRLPTLVHTDMEHVGTQHLAKKAGVDPERIVRLAEVSMSQVMSDDKLDDSDFLLRVELANAMGLPVLLSDYVRYFSLRSWFRRHTKEAIAILMKISDVKNYLFDLDFYDDLEGGALEGLGKLFADNTNVLVYPVEKDGVVTTLSDVQFADKLKYVAQQVIHNKKLVDAEGYDPNLLSISARELIPTISDGPGAWEAAVDPRVLELIKRKGLHGYPG